MTRPFPSPDEGTAPAGAASGGRYPCPKAAGSVSCQHCVDFLIDYTEGALPDDQKFVFESHLAFCPDCAVYVDNYKKTAAIAAKACGPRPSSLPGPVPDGLVEAIIRARKAGG